MMDEASEGPTPLQEKLKQLGRFVAAACVVICLAVGLLGFLQGGDLLEMLLTGVSLAVAAIPEGLPAIVTIHAGAQRGAHFAARRRHPPPARGGDTGLCQRDMHR